MTTVVDPLVVARFWSKVDVRRPGVCWPWRARARHAHGYGIFKVSTQVGVVRAHRFAYELVHGAVPADTVVRHRCDNPPCCNPRHLIPGTQVQNVDDMVRGDRQRNGTTRLSAEQVQTIRDRLASGERQQHLAEQYGICQSQVSQIKTGKRWSA